MHQDDCAKCCGTPIRCTEYLQWSSPAAPVPFDHCFLHSSTLSFNTERKRGDFTFILGTADVVCCRLLPHTVAQHQHIAPQCVSRLSILSRHHRAFSRHLLSNSWVVLRDRTWVKGYTSAAPSGNQAGVAPTSDFRSFSQPRLFFITADLFWIKVASPLAPPCCADRVCKHRRTL